MSLADSFIGYLYFSHLELKAKVCVNRKLDIVRMTYPTIEWTKATWHYVDYDDYDEFYKKYAVKHS